ncbi:MAG: NAD(P)H-dependent oxidoreductase [Clostridia bacterium]|nr:NAD(P)H-dependent oxidoreductase [Clostridia bacterium]
MRYLICNGSPRGSAGFTEVLAQRFLAGLHESGAEDAEILQVGRTDTHAQASARLAEADAVVVVFPLYTDAMPGVLMAFIEQLEPLRGRLGGHALGFIVHSGFPESLHAAAVERYLSGLAARLGASYAGTAAVGGGSWTDGRLSAVRELGRHFAEQGLRFDPDTVRRAASCERFGSREIIILRILARAGMFNRYFNRQLKANGVFHRRFDRPDVPGVASLEGGTR